MSDDNGDKPTTKRPGTNGNGSNGGSNGKVVDLNEVRADVAGPQPTTTTPLTPGEDIKQVPRTFIFHMRDGTTIMHTGYLIVTSAFASMIRSDWDVQFMTPLSQLDFLEQVPADELEQG